MKILTPLLLCALVCLKAGAQTHGEFVTDHQYQLQQLTNSKETLYNRILSDYGHYLRLHPQDYKAKLERCRFIEQAYYDSYEDYNPNEEIARACADTLLSEFPNNPEVLLYPRGLLYSDSLMQYLHTLEKRIAEDESAWGNFRWQVYQDLATQYSYEENDAHVIQYAELAMTANDTLDLSLILAKAYSHEKENDKAIDLIISRLDSTDSPWDLNAKGKLLLELNVPDKALEAFAMAGKKNPSHEDAGAIAEAMINNGLVTEARAFLLKDLQGSSQWNRDQKLTALLKYDLDFGSADSAYMDYRRLTKDNFFADVLGVYRLRLLTKNPFAAWSGSDLAKVSFLILSLSLVIILPYTWILPIHYIGIYQRNKGKIFEDHPFHWSMRHFWIASSAWLFFTLLSSIFFYYPQIIANFETRIVAEDIDLISKETANANIFFFTGLLIFSIAILRSEDITSFFRKIKSNASDIGVGIGLAFALRFALVIYAGILKKSGFDLQSATSELLSINEVIIAINKYYNPLLGFLFVVVFAPFYEEILFRGVFLSACARNMKFIFANILQSLVFAAVHQNLKYFIFYFAFGLIAGHFTRRSGSLITSTSMHMMNNAMAFAVILTMKH